MTDPGGLLNIISAHLAVVNEEPRTDAQFERACSIAEAEGWQDYEDFIATDMRTHRTLWAKPELWKQYYVAMVAEALRWKLIRIEFEKKNPGVAAQADLGRKIMGES